MSSYRITSLRIIEKDQLIKLNFYDSRTYPKTIESAVLNSQNSAQWQQNLEKIIWNYLNGSWRISSANNYKWADRLERILLNLKQQSGLKAQLMQLAKVKRQQNPDGFYFPLDWDKYGNYFMVEYWSQIPADIRQRATEQLLHGDVDIPIDANQKHWLTFNQQGEALQKVYSSTYRYYPNMLDADRHAYSFYKADFFDKIVNFGHFKNSFVKRVN